MKDDTEVIIFTDGSSRGTPGPGGWGTLIIEKAKGKNENEARVTEVGGREDHTTNNRMELMACIEGISRVEKGSTVTVYTDSSYVINGITKWVHGWSRNGWKTKTKEDVLNKDLWMRLADEAESREIEWKYVGGHVGIAGNERCDAIATVFADKKDIQLYKCPISEYKFPGIMDISHDTDKLSAKKSTSSHSKSKAYSYVSMVGGKIETHATWAECEKRVKGARGARYKKSLNPADEKKIIKEFTSSN